jgi:hypothetical protein
VKLIPLSRGLFAKVDDADFDWLNQWNWAALKSGRPGAEPRHFAVRSTVVDGAQQTIMMNRLIMVPPAGMRVAFLDRDTLNNCRDNLLVCTASQSCLNQLGHRDRASRFKGVWWHKRNHKWAASFRAQHLGTFDSEVEAAAAYNHAAASAEPVFAGLNDLSAIGGMARRLLNSGNGGGLSPA